MRIHHLNCGTMCPWGGKLMDGESEGLGESRLVCHCLAIETPQGIVLVDTGLGMRDAKAARERLSGFFRHLLRLRLDPEETALSQLRALGITAKDVRHIVLTHLDFDHAGGIEDFPRARVHVYGDELAAARRRETPLARARYRPQQWDESVMWRTYETNGESWYGFACVRALDGLPPEILMVPLVGHTHGHCGIAVDTGAGWVLHAGDAYFFHGEMDANPHCPPGLRLYQDMMEVNREARFHNQERLRRLVHDHGGEVVVFSAHDAWEMEAAAALTADRDAAAVTTRPAEPEAERPRSFARTTLTDTEVIHGGERAASTPERYGEAPPPPP